MEYICFSLLLGIALLKIKFFYSRSAISLLVGALFLVLTSCTTNKISNRSGQQTGQNVTQQKCKVSDEKIYKSVVKATNRLSRVFDIQKKELMKKIGVCQNELYRLQNTPCKPEKVVEVREKNIYVIKTVNFRRYKRLLWGKLHSIKSLRKRKEVAEKLFFMYMAEKNWTKAYDLYKLYLEPNNLSFFDILLAYIYLNNAETEEAKKIFSNYNKEERKSLKIKFAKFCKRILSYGIFEPKPNQLKKGKSAILYLLLDNAKLVKENDGFRVNFSVRISLNRKKEKFVLLDEENTTSVYRHFVHDILLPIRLQIPLNLSYNYYFMKIDIMDLNSNESVNKILKVKIVE